jgi:FtsP/CotA-like multicopper oxidase with cupredoxin domain
LLGPTIRARNGEIVNVSLQNNYPKKPISIGTVSSFLKIWMATQKMSLLPGGSLNYDLPIIQRAGTYWYHPHSHGSTAKQVFMGLAGLFIVNDDEEAALNLPSGEFEIPIIIQDKTF